MSMSLYANQLSHTHYNTERHFSAIYKWLFEIDPLSAYEANSARNLTGVVRKKENEY